MKNKDQYDWAVLDVKGAHAVDSLGSIDANGDYSVIPSTFRITPPANLQYHIKAMTVEITASNQSGTKYGNINAANIINGVKFCFESDRLTTSPKMFFDQPVFINNDYLTIFATPEARVNYSGGSFAPTWPIHQHGLDIHVDGRYNESFCILLNDDFSNLTTHHFVFLYKIFNFEQNRD